MVELSQVVALVTGGGQGIGRSFVENLLKAGGKVAIADLKNSAGPKTQNELKSIYGERVIFLPCDVTVVEEFEAAIKTTIKTFGQINTIINNAGLANELGGAWVVTIRTNVDGVVNGTKLGFKYMSKENGGTGGIVVNIASVTSLQPFEVSPVYSGTKAFVNQFSRSMGLPTHYNSSGIRVVSINPGFSDTPLLKNAANGLVGKSEIIMKCFENLPLRFPTQNVDNVGRELLTVLKKAENGSLWVIENDEPVKPVDIRAIYG